MLRWHLTRVTLVLFILVGVVFLFIYPALIKHGTALAQGKSTPDKKTDNAARTDNNGNALIAASAVVTAGNGFYNVHVQENVGSGVGLYTATTGPLHPAGPNLNVLYGDKQPRTTFNTIHSYTSGADYVQRDITTALTNPVIYLDRFGTVTAFGTTGFRTTYTLPGPLTATGAVTTPDQLTVVADVKVNGATYEDSAIEVTTIITNDGATPVSIGVRYLWDLQIDRDDGPTFQAINPDGADLYVTESEFVLPSFESYRIASNDTSTRTWVVYGSVNGPLSPTSAPTRPDLLQYACWANAVGTSFDYAVTLTRTVALNSPDCASVLDGDSAMLYFFGRDRNSAVTIPPGGSYRVSAFIFATEPPQFFINLTPSNATPDIRLPYTVTATVHDEQGNPVTGKQVLFTITGANPRTCFNAPPTNLSGQTACTYTGTVRGPDSIVAWLEQNNNAMRDPAEIFATATVTWSSFYTVAVAPSTATRDVGTQHTVTATVVNRLGAPVPDLNLDFVITRTNTTACFNGPVTDANGQTRCTYTGNNTGSDGITAWVDETDNNLRDADEFFATATITWTPVYTITVTPPTATLAVGAQHTVTATVVDHRLAPAPGLDVDFISTGANPATCLAAPPTDANGQTRCTYTGDNPGGDSITAWVDTTDNDQLDADEFFGGATANWTPVYTIMLTPPTVRDIGMEVSVTAVVSDHRGQRVPNLRVDFCTQGVHNRCTVQATNANGAASLIYPYNAITNTTAADSISAWIDRNGNHRPDPSEFLATTTVTWLKIDVSLFGRGRQVNDIETIRTITVTVVNSLNNASSGITVGFKVEGGTMVPSRMSKTNQLGQAIFTYISKVPPAGSDRSGEAGSHVRVALKDLITVWADLNGNNRPDDKQSGDGEPVIEIGVVTAVTLVSFTAQPTNDKVTLTWITAVEIDNAGFNLYRAPTAAGPYNKINDQLIGAQGSGSGASYSFVDMPPGTGLFYYKLEDIDYNGVRTLHGPVDAGVGLGDGGAQPIYLPLVQR